MLSLAAIPEFLTQPAIWVAIIAVVLALIFGFSDITRFSLYRARAIARVCFDESIRRRVLWLIPLAIIGVIIVSQLQRPLDEADAIRQTTKFCLFATGLLVVMSAIILACTNLPREIESRVIYTVVTKPTTRLEIVIGKVMGFGQVSATILLIMGVFSWAYLSVRAASLRHDISDRLAAGAVEPISKPSLEHYRDYGLLTAQKIKEPEQFEVYSRVPSGPVRWAGDITDGDVIIPFDVPNESLLIPGEEEKGIAPYGLVVHLKVQAHPAPTSTNAKKPKPATSQPFISPLLVQPNGENGSSGSSAKSPEVVVSILDQFQNLLVDSGKFNGGKAAALAKKDGEQDIFVQMAPGGAGLLVNHPKFYVSVSGTGLGNLYGYTDKCAEILLLNSKAQAIAAYASAVDTNNPGHPMPAIFRGREGTYGQQLRGAQAAAPIAVFPFRNSRVNAINGQVPMEFKVSIERTGLESEESTPTLVELQVFNRNTGSKSEPITIRPENLRTSYFNVPETAIVGGNFDIAMRCLTNEQWIGLRSDSLSVVAGHELFVFNLFKSLLIIWLMTLLVVIIAIFASTFLSWPVALMLTIFLLLGHWVVGQLGDATAPGIGNQVATDLGLTKDPAKAKVVSNSVEALSGALRKVSEVLPDIGQYSATDDIERGIVVAPAHLWDAFAVTAMFGIPMIALAYVFLKNKEVAP